MWFTSSFPSCCWCLHGRVVPSQWLVPSCASCVIHVEFLSGWCLHMRVVWFASSFPVVGACMCEFGDSRRVSQWLVHACASSVIHVEFPSGWCLHVRVVWFTSSFPVVGACVSCLSVSAERASHYSCVSRRQALQICLWSLRNLLDLIC